MYLKHIYTSTNYFLNYFPIIFLKVENLKVKISKSILEVHFIFRVQQYIRISARQNISRSIHNLWSNDLMVRAQVYQTRCPRLKAIWWLKTCVSLSSFKGQLNEQQGFLEIWWLKISLDCDSVAFRQLNCIHKVVHWHKSALKRDYNFFWLSILETGFLQIALRGRGIENFAGWMFCIG